MKEFEHFIRKGDVKKQNPDKNTSRAVFQDALDRTEYAETIFRNAKAKYVLENAYEAMREAADALLYLHGYKSFSHEASIVYLIGKGFNTKELDEFDRFRKIRNDIKYYGGTCDEEDAKHCLELAKKIIEKIKILLEPSE